MKQDGGLRSFPPPPPTLLPPSFGLLIFRHPPGLGCSHFGLTGQPPPVPLDGLLCRRRLEIARQVGEESRRCLRVGAVFAPRLALPSSSNAALLLCCLVSSVGFFLRSWGRRGVRVDRSAVSRPTQELRVRPPDESATRSRLAAATPRAHRLHVSDRFSRHAQGTVRTASALIPTIIGAVRAPRHYRSWWSHTLLARSAEMLTRCSRPFAPFCVLGTARG